MNNINPTDHKNLTPIGKPKDYAPQRGSIQELTPNTLTVFKQALEKEVSSLQIINDTNLCLEKFITTTVNAIKQNPKLLEVDQRSLFAACRKAVKEGLICDGDEAALVPYKGKIEFIPMIKGMIRQLYRTKEVTSIKCDIVYENEDFKCISGDDEKIIHHKIIGPGKGKFAAVYVIIKLKNFPAEINLRPSNMLAKSIKCSAYDN